MEYWNGRDFAALLILAEQQALDDPGFRAMLARLPTYASPDEAKAADLTLWLTAEEEFDGD